MVQSNAPAEIYQLHILLLQINPPIWRRLHVRSDSSIATLHELLQIAFDWSDFHLHRFVIRGKEYGLSRIGCTTFRSASKASSPSAKRSSTRFALVGLVHHRPKIAVGRHDSGWFW